MTTGTAASLTWVMPTAEGATSPVTLVSNETETEVVMGSAVGRSSRVLGPSGMGVKAVVGMSLAKGIGRLHRGTESGTMTLR